MERAWEGCVLLFLERLAAVVFPFIHDVSEGSRVGLVWEHLALKPVGVMTVQWDTHPLELPWFELRCPFELSLVVETSFFLRVCSGCDKAAVHAVDEDVDAEHCFHDEGSL